VKNSAAAHIRTTQQSDTKVIFKKFYTIANCLDFFLLIFKSTKVQNQF